MHVSKKILSLFLINFSYISSIIYVPLLVAGHAVSNKILPIISLLLLIFILKNEIKLKHLKTFHFVFFIAISFMVSVGGLLSLVYTVVFLSFLLFIFPYFVLFKLYGEVFIRRHLFFILYTSFLSVIFAWFEYLYPATASEIFFLRGSIYSEKGQVSSFFSNPNMLGIMVAISFQIANVLYKKNIIILSSIFLVFLSGVWLTGSRMAMGLIIAIFILKIIPIIKISQTFLICLAISLTFYMSINFHIMENYVNLNLRGEVWGGALSAFSSNIFFGIGLGQFEQDIGLYVFGHDKQSPNNLFVGLLSEVGFVGFVLFFCLILRTLYSYFKKPVKNHINYQSSVMVMFLIISQLSEYLLLHVGSYVLLLVLFLAVVEWSKE